MPIAESDLVPYPLRDVLAQPGPTGRFAEPYLRNASVSATG
ncbi:MAG: hypothetical protein QNK04_23580 [Myxococcota bacterium]|nr:hypothetical protein [Myxococcota bacterium]